MKKILLSITFAICAVAFALGAYNHHSTIQTSNLIFLNIEALTKDTNPILTWCATEFQSVDSGGWWSVNCSFCNWDLYGIHSGSGSCWMAK